MSQIMSIDNISNNEYIFSMKPQIEDHILRFNNFSNKFHTNYSDLFL